MQLIALFNESDVDHSRSIDLNEWCLARGRLLEVMRSMEEQRTMQRREAKQAAATAEVLRRKSIQLSIMGGAPAATPTGDARNALGGTADELLLRSAWHHVGRSPGSEVPLLT